MKNGTLYGVGVGPGDPELLTLKAIKTIEKCNYIACPESSSGENVAYGIAAQVVDLSNKKVLMLDLPMTRNSEELRISQEKASLAIIEVLESGEDVAFLTLGDPSIYSTYGYIHEILNGRGYETSIIPGITSFCSAASSLNTMLVQGGEALHIIPASYKNNDELSSLSGCKVLMKSGKSLKKVLDNIGYKESYTIDIVERSSMKGERVFKNIKSIDDDLSYFSLVVIKDGVE
ncbi:MAG: precorrin-2 C(20)-methyltransferase [Clostridium sp.]